MYSPKQFKNKYRINSTRLPNWDYTSPGCYFVTICTKNRFPFFGNVIKGNMVLSNIGKIIFEEWSLTKKIRPNIGLDVFTIMPNHLHGMIIIKEPSNIVETSRRDVSTATHKKPKYLIANSLGSIINQFKSKCTKRIHAEGNQNFAWQSRFYEHIVQNEKSLNKIKEYIVNNPTKWERDMIPPEEERGKDKI